MNPVITREQVEIEARAKILWGDEPEMVVRYLMMNGVSNEEAWEFVDNIALERIASVRAIGVRRIFIGIGLIAVPIIVFLSGVWRLSIHLLGASVAVGLFGAWKLLQGILMLIFPESEKGDLADKSD